MRYWVMAAGLVVAAVAGLGIWHQTNRVHFIQTLCEAGLPNLSRPGGIDADRLECVVLGPSRRVSGFLLGEYHLSALLVGDAVRLDDRGVLANEVLDMAGGSSRSDFTLSDLREMREKAPDVCHLTIWRVTLDGWSTETDGPYGYSGLPSRGFFHERLVAIEPVTRAQVAEIDTRMRERACIWTGEAGWVHLGTDQAEPVSA